MGKPDFLCVGMQKAGTGSLWKFLSNDSRFWMPMVKELAHFNRGSLKEKKLQRARNYHDRFSDAGWIKRALINRRRAARGQKPVSRADVGFAENYYSYLLNNRTDEDYLKLFSTVPPGKLTGDITPNYSGIREDKIEHGRHGIGAAAVVGCRQHASSGRVSAASRGRDQLAQGDSKIGRRSPGRASCRWRATRMTRPMGRCVLERGATRRSLRSRCSDGL